MKISDWLRQAKATLTESGCPDPEIDARWMAEDVLGMTRVDLKFESEREVSPNQLNRLNDMLSRRADGEPVQYILERADFMGLKFHVDKRVLIPRQDTETLAEQALIALTPMGEADALDLCTGSGCVGLSLKSLAPLARVTLTDISKDALEVAKLNAGELGLDVTLRCGDLFHAVENQRFDLIASNPPYIPHADLESLQPEVQHEPMLALDGGTDGLEIYRRIAQDAPRYLKPGGELLLEVGIGEAQAVQALLKINLNCVDTGIVKDLNGIERVVWAKV